MNLDQRFCWNGACLRLSMIIGGAVLLASIIAAEIIYHRYRHWRRPLCVNGHLLASPADERCDVCGAWRQGMTRSVTCINLHSMRSGLSQCPVCGAPPTSFVKCADGHWKSQSAPCSTCVSIENDRRQRRGLPPVAEQATRAGCPFGHPVASHDQFCPVCGVKP